MWSKYKFSLLACAALAIVGRSEALPKPIEDGDSQPAFEDVAGDGDKTTLIEIADIDEIAQRKKRDILDVFSYFFYDEDYYDEYEQAYIICKNCTIVQQLANTAASTTTTTTVVVPQTTTSVPQIVETTAVAAASTQADSTSTKPKSSTEASSITDPNTTSAISAP